MESSPSLEATASNLEDFIEIGKGIVDENDVLNNTNEENIGCQQQPKESLMLSIGMEFNSIEEAYYYYNTYAKMKGFGVRRSTSHYDRKSNTVCRKLFVCEKEGTKRTNDPREVGKQVKRRADIRKRCKAKMLIKLKEGGRWVVDIFDDMHSHEMSTPSKVAKIRSHKKLTAVSKNLVDELYHCGIGPSKITRVMNQSGGVVHEGEFTSHDCRNYLSKARKNNDGRQCMKVLDYFQRKVGVEEGFFFKMEVDDSNQVRSVFWADNRARMAYMQFGDVIVFDVTYNTNSFKMPFAPFTGINHHRQSTLFGCALLAYETTSTFTWLFQTWLECMWGKEPQCIITDQDLAMRKAIAYVLPRTRHRFCSWHIGRNGMMHLNQLGKHIDFEKDYNEWIHADTVKESEAKWNEIKEKYKIEEGSWLAGMYQDRKHWINAYLKDDFFAGMTSSQRSESINAFFDGFVNAQTPISEFVHQYDNALQVRRQEEATEDHKSLHMKPTLHVGNALEEHARSVYTRKMFSLFQEELKLSLVYKCKEVGSEGCSQMYEVKKNATDEKHHIVYLLDKPEFRVNCTCKKFEGEGILCRHILRVLFQLDIDEIPEKYILFRWTINARYSSSATLKIVNDNQASCTSPYMMYSFRSAMYRIANSICLSPQHWNIAMPMLKSVVDELDHLSLMNTSQVENTPQSSVAGVSTEVSNAPVQQVSQIERRDPTRLKCKGRPKIGKRLKSSAEIGVCSQVKKRKCELCQKIGHYMSTCQLNKEKHQLEEIGGGETNQIDIDNAEAHQEDF